MVAHQILVLLVEVRILVGQPKTPPPRRFFCTRCVFRRSKGGLSLSLINGRFAQNYSKISVKIIQK